MGGKTETVEGVGTQKMFPKEINLDLFSANITRQVALYKTIDPAVLLPGLLEIKKNFNPLLLEKLSASNIAKSTSSRVSEPLVLAAIQAEDPLATDVVSWRYVYGEVWSMRAYVFETYGPGTVNDCGIEEFVFGDGTFSCSNPRYEIVGSAEMLVFDLSECVFNDPNWELVFVREESTAKNENSILEVTYLRDPADPILYGYVHTNGLLVDSLDTYSYLTLNYKANFKEVDQKYIKIINRIMGTSEKSLQESIDDDKIKDFFLTYSAKWTSDTTDRDSAYYDIIAKLMNWDDADSSGYEVQWNVNGVDQRVTYARTDDSGYRMYINGVEYIADKDDDGTVEQEDTPQHMIPIEFFQERIMRDQYNDLRNVLTYFAFVVDEVDIAWYQTWLFQALLWVVAVVFAFNGMPQMLIGMLGAEVVKRLPISSEIKAAISIVISVMTFNPGTGVMAIVNTVNFALKIASQLLTFYFKAALTNIQEEMEALDEETQEVKDKIAEMAHKAIYMPLDAISDIYDNIYELAYDAYDMAYEFDGQIQVDVLTDYSYKPSKMEDI